MGVYFVNYIKGTSNQSIWKKALIIPTTVLSYYIRFILQVIRFKIIIIIHSVSLEYISETEDLFYNWNLQKNESFFKDFNYVISFFEKICFEIADFTDLLLIQTLAFGFILFNILTFLHMTENNTTKESFIK